LGKCFFKTIKAETGKKFTAFKGRQWGRFFLPRKITIKIMNWGATATAIGTVRFAEKNGIIFS